MILGDNPRLSISDIAHFLCMYPLRHGKKGNNVLGSCTNLFPAPYLLSLVLYKAKLLKLLWLFGPKHKNLLQQPPPPKE